jgi:hypothetical protein
MEIFSSKGKLTKIKGKWFIDFVFEKRGENNWHHSFPIFELEQETESMADCKLSKYYNKPINELEGLDVDFKYLISDGVTNFAYEYAIIFE